MGGTIRVGIVVLAVCLGVGAAAADGRLPTPLSDKETAAVNAIAPALHVAKIGERIRLHTLSEEGDGVVPALATVILFRVDPGRYKDRLFEIYAVRDYALRRQGRYDMVALEDVLADFGRIEKGNPGIRDKDILALLAFLHFRDANTWFMDGTQKVSAARFFRGYFLAVALESTGIDSLAIANAIDVATRKSMGQ